MTNKTNVTIIGVAGQSIIDGSSGLGQCLVVSNCSDLVFEGLTFRGMTNHNFLQLPGYPGTLPNSYLWAGVSLYQVERIRFENCRFERHADHGLEDFGAGPSYQPPATNQIIVRRCSFEDIGGWRAGNAGAVYADGGSIIATGWTIDECSFMNALRGVESYDESDAGGQVHNNLVIRNCVGYNLVDFFISSAGSTNTHNALIIGNRFENPVVGSYHGTNMGPAQAFSWFTTGYFINGGRGWRLVNNVARGGMYQAYYVGNSSSFCDDVTLEGNSALNIDRGDFLGYGFWIGELVDTAAAASSARRLILRNNLAFKTATVAYLINGGRDLLIDGNQAIDPTAYNSWDISYAGFKVGQVFSNNKLTNCTLIGNRVIDNTATARFSYGFNSSIQSCVAIDNYASGANLAQDNGITNTVGANVTLLGPELRFGVTFDFPAIGPRAQATTSFAAVGVTSNSLVTVSVPANLFASGTCTNVCFTAWGSNDTIYVRCHNVDAVSSADPPSSRINAIARQVHAFRE
jgi:hypothetical protein